MSDVVSVVIADGVADVRLSRPDVLNAFDDDLFEGLIEVGEALRADASVRAVVLSGYALAPCSFVNLTSSRLGVVEFTNEAGRQARGSRGSPSAFSARMFRCTSDVPA